MERTPDSNRALEWEFRCRGTTLPGRPWEWRCRARGGSVIASSKGAFASLDDAITDARSNGFTCERATFEVATPVTGTAAAVEPASLKFGGIK